LWVLVFVVVCLVDWEWFLGDWVVHVLGVVVVGVELGVGDLDYFDVGFFEVVVGFDVVFVGYGYLGGDREGVVVVVLLFVLGGHWVQVGVDLV